MALHQEEVFTRRVFDTFRRFLHCFIRKEEMAKKENAFQESQVGFKAFTNDIFPTCHLESLREGLACQLGEEKSSRC